VPYAIGTRLYFAGQVVDLSGRFTAAFPGLTPTPSQRQFATVVGGAGFAWTQIVGSGTDVVNIAGRVSRDGGYTPFHTSSGRSSLLAITTGGLVAMPENGQVYDTSGGFRGAFTGSAGIDCGSCAPTAAGPRLVIDQWSGVPGTPDHQGTWLWYPPAAIEKIDDRLVAVGRLGGGTLGLRLGDGCWRTAPATAPTRLGARICSLTRPLVSADGRRAVVVQGGRVVVLDPVTGSLVSRASMPAIDRWAPPSATATVAHVRYAVPAAWESADSYLVSARYDTSLALVRCSVRTGACTRAVRAAVRPGVDGIVTERGPADAAG
jgi:hypothetical protein